MEARESSERPMNKLDSGFSAGSISAENVEQDFGNRWMTARATQFPCTSKDVSCREQTRSRYSFASRMGLPEPEKFRGSVGPNRRWIAGRGGGPR